MDDEEIKISTLLISDSCVVNKYHQLKPHIKNLILNFQMTQMHVMVTVLDVSQRSTYVVSEMTGNCQAKVRICGGNRGYFM